jgi:LPXTG-motif cell wall-anchored protein
MFNRNVWPDVSSHALDLYSDTPPQTGDNTVLYLAIAASALAAMTALVVRRKRESV